MRLHYRQIDLASGDMERITELGEKLSMALKAMNLSRVALAQKMGVDKSLVGRWLSGSVHPTEHNLARIAGLVATWRPDFTLADWHLGRDAFAARFGIEAPPRTAHGGTPSDDPLMSFLQGVGGELQFRGGAYEGFWRTSRPSLLVKDRVFHDYGMIFRNSQGMLEVRMHGAGLDFRGMMLPAAGNVFVFLLDMTGGTPMSVQFKGVSLPKAMVLDGILMFAALDPDRTPAAVPIILERIEDLCGDQQEDEETLKRICGEERAPIASLDDATVASRIFRDVGPNAALEGKEMFLSVRSADSLSRGITVAGLEG
jgi:transcriptional regulator with XRE-family HTH domain